LISILPLSTVLIAILIIIVLREKQKRGSVITQKETVALITALVLGVIGSLGAIGEFLTWAGITPADFVQNQLIIGLVIIAASLAVIAIYICKNYGKITPALNLEAKSRIKLKKEIKKKFELIQPFFSTSVLSFADSVSDDIINHRLIQDYTIELYPRDGTYVLIGDGHKLRMSLNEGKLLLEKIKEIERKTRYKGNKLFYLLIP
jgi:hypothetical protein